jgi:uncharacterized membrane-anchored protein
MKRADNILGLLITLLLSVIGFFGLLALLYFILKFFAASIDRIPFFEKAFVFVILSLPALVLLFAWTVFFKRVKHHSSPAVRTISYSIAGLAILAGLFFYGKDLWQFFSTWKDEVTNYTTYGRYFIVGNISALFLTAMLQALTLPKEKDWRER